MTAADILRHRLQVEISRHPDLDVSVVGKRPSARFRVPIPAQLWSALAEIGIDLLAPARRAEYLVDAVERGLVPDTVDTGDEVAVLRLLRMYEVARRHWATAPMESAVIASFRSWIVGQVAHLSSHVPDTDVWRQLTDLWQREIPSGRTQAVLAAEEVGELLGHSCTVGPDHKRDGIHIRDRDSKRVRRTPSGHVAMNLT